MFKRLSYSSGEKSPQLLTCWWESIFTQLVHLDAQAGLRGNIMFKQLLAEMLDSHRVQMSQPMGQPLPTTIDRFGDRVQLAVVVG